MGTSDLAYFEGAWTTAERKRVTTAARETETEGGEAPKGPGRPWILLRRDLGNEALYMASRLGESEVLIGRSATILADRIRTRTRPDQEAALQDR